MTVSDAESVSTLTTTASTTIAVPSGGSLTLANNGNDAIGLLQLNAGATLSLGAGANLTVGNANSFYAGTVNVGSNATVDLYGNGISGPINTAAGSQVVFIQSDFTATSGAALNGSGQFELSQGTLSIDTDLSVQNFSLVSSNTSLTGTNNLTITSTFAAPNGGTIGTNGGGGAAARSPSPTGLPCPSWPKPTFTASPSRTTAP